MIYPTNYASLPGQQVRQNHAASVPSQVSSVGNTTWLQPGHTYTHQQQSNSSNPTISQPPTAVALSQPQAVFTSQQQTQQQPVRHFQKELGPMILQEVQNSLERYRQEMKQELTQELQCDFHRAMQQFQQQLAQQTSQQIQHEINLLSHIAQAAQIQHQQACIGDLNCLLGRTQLRIRELEGELGRLRQGKEAYRASLPTTGGLSMGSSE